MAYIRHEAFEPIRTELLELGFPSLSISEVKGSGRQKGITERYRGAELTNYLRPKVKLECVVADGDVQTIVDTILKHARTGAVGDGKVFVLPVEEATASAPARPARRPSRPTRTRPAAAVSSDGSAVTRCSGTAPPAEPRRPCSAGRTAAAASTSQMVEPSSAATACERGRRLASQAAGAPVAIVVPRLEAARAPRAGVAPRPPARAARYVADRAARPAGRTVPAGVTAEVPIALGRRAASAPC